MMIPIYIPVGPLFSTPSPTLVISHLFVKRADLKCSHQSVYAEKLFFKQVTVGDRRANQLDYGDHFTMYTYIYQTITLNTLKYTIFICQLYTSIRAGKKFILKTTVHNLS